MRPAAQVLIFDSVFFAVDGLLAWICWMVDLYAIR